MLNISAGGVQRMHRIAGSINVRNFNGPCNVCSSPNNVAQTDRQCDKPQRKEGPTDWNDSGWRAREGKGLAKTQHHYPRSGIINHNPLNLTRTETSGWRRRPSIVNIIG